MLKVTNDFLTESHNLIERTTDNMNIKLILTSISGAIGYVVGGWTEIMTALIVLMCFDILTGHIKSSKINKVSSKIGFNGLLRKGLIFMVIIMAHIIDRISPIGIEGITVKDLVVLWYLWNEFISVIHNLEEIGIRIPKFLTSIISSKKNDINRSMNNVTGDSEIIEPIVEEIISEDTTPLAEELIIEESIIEEDIYKETETVSNPVSLNKYEIKIQFGKK